MMPGWYQTSEHTGLLTRDYVTAWCPSAQVSGSSQFGVGRAVAMVSGTFVGGSMGAALL